MTIDPKLQADIQLPSPGDIVQLFDLDLTPIGGADVYHFTPGTMGGVAPVWRGNTYVPFPLEANGFDWTGRGTLPTPKIIIANAAAVMLAAVIQYNDLLGARVTRWKTLTKYLDGQPDADPNVYFQPDVYYVERKVSQTKTAIEWDLSSALDQQGKILPNRQIIRDSCNWLYRRWDVAAGEFVYGSCPYAGTNMFTRDGAGTVDPTQDVCGKRLFDCKARFGAGAELPFAGFTSVSRIR